MSKENNSKKKHLAQAPLLTCATEGIKLLVKSVFETVSNPSSVPTPLLACVAGAKRGGRGGGRKARKTPLPFSLFPYPLPLSTPNP